MKKFLATTITTVAFAVFGLASVASAQAPAGGGGQALEIGPPLINLTGDPGQTLTTAVSLRDVTNDKLVVSNEINDFVAAGEDGTPKLLLKNEENPYSMRTWITPLPKFTLVPKQIQTLQIKIKIPTTAAPGGYYSVIRFSGSPPGVEGNGVALSASLGALVFLRVNGDAKEQLTSEEFFTADDNSGKKNWLFESAPFRFVERIKNSGNLHEQPVGQVTVKDMFGNEIGRTNVNLPPRNILPGSIRRFEQTFDSSIIGNRFLFGKYTAELKVTYGGSVQELTSKLDFWVIPYRLIAGIILGLIAAGVLIRYGLKRYRDRILGSSRGGSRRR